MAKKVTGYIKLQIPAAKATPAPPVGPALGQHGVNIMGFCKEFNEKTASQAGLIIPVVITVYAKRAYGESSSLVRTPFAHISMFYLYSKYLRLCCLNFSTSGFQRWLISSALLPSSIMVRTQSTPISFSKNEVKNLSPSFTLR